MATPIVQSAYGSNDNRYGTGTTSVVVPLPAPVQPGHSIYVFVSYSGYPGGVNLAITSSGTTDDFALIELLTYPPTFGDPYGYYEASYIAHFQSPGAAPVTVTVIADVNIRITVTVFEINQYISIYPDDFDAYVPDQTALYLGSFIPQANWQGVGSGPITTSDTLILFNAAYTDIGFRGGPQCTLMDMQNSPEANGTVSASSYNWSTNFEFCTISVNGALLIQTEGEYFVRFAGQVNDLNGNPAQFPTFGNFSGGVPDFKVRTFTKRKPRTSAIQTASRGGYSAVTGVYAGDTSLETRFPAMPNVGDVIVVGASSDKNNSVPINPFSEVSDAYGNTYTFQGISYSSAGNRVVAIWTSTVQFRPVDAQGNPTDLFRVTLEMSDPGGALGLYLLQIPMPTTGIQFAAYLDQTGIGNNLELMRSNTLQAAAPGYAVSVAFNASVFGDGPYPYTLAEQAGYTRAATNFYDQVTDNQLTQRSRVGVGAIMYKLITAAGSVDAQITTNAGSMGIALILVTATSLAIACPLINTVQVGQMYTGQIVVTGGIPPYAYAITSGSLPPGLTLGAATGVISGTATVAGAYSYEVTVTDAAGSTIAITCAITVTGSGGGSGATGSCRTVLNIWQHAVSPQVEIIADRFDDWTNCGTPHNKFFQGIILDGDTFGANKNIWIRDADTGAGHLLQPSPINHNGRQTKPYSFATPFLAHSVRRESLDMVPYRQGGIEYIFEPSPEFTYTWKTQRTSHGLRGFHFIQRILFTYAASANVTLTITAFDGVSPAVITLPSTSGVPQKVVVIVSANKGLLYEYLVTSASPFQIWESSLEVVIGQWGRAGAFINYPLVGTVAGDRATI